MPRQLVVHVVGARPNYIKVAPVYAALDARGSVEQRLVHTGQHYDALLSDVFFAELPLPRPHVQLDARTPESATEELEQTFAELAPDLVVVAGDVNSTLAGAVAARKLGIRVCHVESGLRSHDWSMPEEVNRVITDHLSALLLSFTYLFPYFPQLWSGWPLTISVILAVGVWTVALEYLERPSVGWGSLAGLILGAIVLVHGTELYTLVIVLPLVLIGARDQALGRRAHGAASNSRASSDPVAPVRGPILMPRRALSRMIRRTSYATR